MLSKGVWGFGDWLKRKASCTILVLSSLFVTFFLAVTNGNYRKYWCFCPFNVLISTSVMLSQNLCAHVSRGLVMWVKKPDQLCPEPVCIWLLVIPFPITQGKIFTLKEVQWPTGKTWLLIVWPISVSLPPIMYVFFVFSQNVIKPE